jgi:hypothetical protein
LATQKPYGTAYDTSGSSAGPPSASARSINPRAWSNDVLGVGRREALGVHLRVRVRDLQRDPVAAQRRDLGQRAGELRFGLHQRRARQRSLSSLAPQSRGLLDQAGIGATARQLLGLAFGDVG